MKYMKKKKKFPMTSTGSTVTKTTESIFADTVSIYDSKVSLDRWSGKVNDNFQFILTFWTCGDHHYEIYFLKEYNLR